MHFRLENRSQWQLGNSVNESSNSYSIINCEFEPKFGKRM